MAAFLKNVDSALQHKAAFQGNNMQTERITDQTNDLINRQSAAPPPELAQGTLSSFIG